MKKFTLMLAAALIAVLSYAQVPMQKSVRAIPAQQSRSMASKMLAKPGQKQHKGWNFAPRRAASDYTIITDTPKGEMKTYTRSGSCFVDSGNEDGEVYEGTQSGKINIVYNGNEVYLQGVVAGNTYGDNNWVKGFLSEDGTTIHLPLFQNVYYYGTYDACMMIAVGKVSGDAYTVNELVEEVTYTIDGETITLNDSSIDNLFGLYWTDDHSWQGYGEWDTVLTEYNADYTLVTPPAGLTTTKLPLSAYNWDEEQVTGTAKVGVDGSDVYFQGLVKDLPEVWLKGTVSDDIVTIPITYIGQLSGQDLWAAGYGSGGLSEMLMFYDSENNTYELDGYLLLNTNDDTFVYDPWYGDQSFIEAYTGLFIGNRPATVEVPADLEVKNMPMTGVNDEGETVESSVNVGISGNDVYIQGLLSEVAEGWIKGSLNEDKTQAVFPIQYVGAADGMGYSVYLMGGGSDVATSEEPTSVVFSYDEEANVLTSQNVIFSNAHKEMIYYASYYEAGLVIGSAVDATWVAANQGYENAQGITQIDIDPGVTVGALSQADGTNPPKYYDSGTSLRLYAGNTMVVTSSKPIVKMVFTLTGNDKQMTLTADKGNYELAGNKGTWTGEANEITFAVPSISGLQARIQRIDVYYLNYSKTLVVAPEDLVTEAYYFNGIDTYYNEEDKRPVQVGFYGDEVYFQGLSGYIEDAWVKGTLKDGKVTIPGWNIGLYESFIGTFELVFSGAEMTYDAEADKFTCAAFQTIPVGNDFYMDEYADVTITKIIEKAATPAQPEITRVTLDSSYPNLRMNVPMVDVNGDPMVPEKLGYQLFSDINGTVAELVFDPSEYGELTEELTIIPYLFTDGWDISAKGATVYLNQANIADWNKVGVKSIYTGGGETHESEIFWYTIKEADGISTIVATEETDAPIYNLQGVRVKKPQQKGIYISNGRKVVVK